VVVIAYTGHTSFSGDYPATFLAVSADDGIVNVPVMDRRVENLRKAGVAVEYLKFKNAGHGFGTGAGTDAEGWIEQAIRFWDRHR
jgi:acetyl esterase/lipase